MILRLLGLLFFLIATDVLSWLFMREFLRSYKFNTRIFSRIWWSLTIGFLVFYIAYLLYAGSPGHDYTIMRNYFAFFGLFLLLYLPKAIIGLFYLANNILSLFLKILMAKKPWLSKTMGWLSLVSAGFMFFSVAYGIVYGKTRFTVKNIEIQHPLLPAAFDGFRILQYSDTHLGSFSHTEDAIKGFDLIKDQKVDAIVFTGDMVNMVPEEAEPYREALTGINAPSGKYAVLGNHDLDDYRKWDKSSLKSEEIVRLANFHTSTGSQLLRNTHEIIRRGSDSIFIAGVDNWGLPPFHPHGDLAAAVKGIPEGAFTILLSHDPSHWDAQVLPTTGIALTLSGHTHGMQFALNLGKRKWSPISNMYPHWYGLFEQQGQYLYVNPGFGFIGFNGRVGMPPEITVITLRKSAK
jgi:predicted MPP superfamily phosphohydrolase